MKTQELNPALQAELERLIAEQERDDRDMVKPTGALSLDAPLTDEEGSGSFYERLLEEEIVEGGPVRSGPNRRIRPAQVKEWRALRNKDGWTYQQIADYAGVMVQTVRHHIAPNSRISRASAPQLYLIERIKDLCASYEAGASLRELAQLHYEVAGYSSWQSCYQGLRELLPENGIVLRPKGDTTKHGMRRRDASLKDQRRYWRQQNELAKERRRKQLVQCDAVTREGRPCRRWAVLGGRYCMNHDERTKRQPKWTRDVVIAALKVWANDHGRPPQAKDWPRATDDRPSFKTVTDLFGRWNVALYEAGLRKRKYPERGTCTVNGCPRKQKSRGWCGTHYQRWLRHGDPQTDVPIEEKAA